MDNTESKRGINKSTLLLLSVFVIATCGLIYELIAGTLASYLLGDSVTQFSTIIGTYLFSMGIGSYLSRYIHRNLILWFIKIELMTQRTVMNKATKRGIADGYYKVFDLMGRLSIGRQKYIDLNLAEARQYYKILDITLFVVFITMIIVPATILWSVVTGNDILLYVSFSIYLALVAPLYFSFFKVLSRLIKNFFTDK